MLKGKHVKFVTMEVDAFLAKGSALKDVRNVGDEVGGTEPLGHDSCEGGFHRQEKGNLDRSYVEYSGPK